MKRILAALSFALLGSTHAAEIQHLQGRAFLQDDRASTPLARGLVLPAETHLVVEKGAQVLVKISDDSSLEIQGPAQATLSAERFWNFESGRFLVYARSLSPHRFRIFDETIRPDDASFEVEIPISRAYAQILLMRGSQEILGEDLEPHRLYVFEKGRVQSGEIKPEDVIKRRDSYVFSEALFRRLEEGKTVEALRNQLVFTQVSAMNLLTQSDDASNRLRSTSFGAGVEWVHKRYFNLPKRPQRIHFLRSPALRLGVGVLYSTTSSNEAVGEHLLFPLRAFVGTSWRGLLLDGLVQYSQLSGDGVTQSPLQYGFRAAYEWDLKDDTETDVMFALGYGYTVSNFDSWAKFAAVSHSVALSFIFNF
jgi:hypothetical protein